MKSGKSHPALRGQLIAYSAAAAAAMAATGTAEAQAITNLTADKFTGALSISHVVVNHAPTFHGATGSFQVGGKAISLQTRQKASYGFSGGSASGGKSFYAEGVGAAGVGFRVNGSKMLELANGAAIAGGAFGQHGMLADLSARYLGGDQMFGSFGPAVTGSKSGYIAFKVGAEYGWVGVAVHRTGDVIDDLKFADPNHDGIYGAFGTGVTTVGQIAATAPIPEPGSTAAGLGILALGAAGVREHRRRKQQAA